MISDCLTSPSKAVQTEMTRIRIVSAHISLLSPLKQETIQTSLSNYYSRVSFQHGAISVLTINLVLSISFNSCDLRVLEPPAAANSNFTEPRVLPL